ncbi:At2g45480/F4L23.1 [Arabidopsis lyrata subsp. lyrata]|uniref:Growth-regulating factor n=3 Tax=Arabidopsis lyrata subsp. lyrata TaxID=81972 RepID=D7LCJ7_ARALL|nr:growth-regulating factor 9 isoform X1 [Arabidopsis lyrata subsp. lyrata]EFH56440.1 At2g45480/F4L23.1 [Arabidopsis lyrata subsp. lyrata]|eukprot:XP_002880181.1 growth-regulating factor 9 isoform X1 [Arabidopsis lyrata subsp. lyrata]
MKMQSPKMEQEEVEVERMGKKWPWMKAAQLMEFRMQTLVYRYIEAGLRVPHHLVVPIWNSLALSSSSNYNYHSSSLLSNKGVNHIDTVEPEPTRCRRTDGKKWRCRNRVLLYEKYCERHMHRGRKRSRKLVESSYEVASSSTKHDNTCGLDRNNDSQSVLRGTISGSSNAQVVTIASLPSARACDDVIRPSLVISESTNKSVSYCDRSRRNMEISCDDFISTKESSLCVRVVPLQGDENLPSVQKFFPEVSDNSLEAAKFSSNRKNDIIARSREWKNMNVVNGGLFSSIHFSPDTVLQERGVFRLQRVDTDNEPGRCRRTDGKKWRCSKDALSGQKYCDKHMHRGIKKKHPVDTTNLHERSGFSPLTVKSAARSVSCKDGDDQKLSVSVMGIPLPRVSDEKSSCSYSTDTTITDTALRGEEDDEEYLSLFSSGV